MPKKPNVLIFCVDEMRADHLACAGNPIVQTPNLDRLAARGTVFTRSYCNNPICMPARATMFTGLLPRDHGVRINGQSLRRDLPTLPGILAVAGYRTHSAGKLHLTPWVPMVDPPDLTAHPESMDSWKRNLIRKLPVPYYGFQSADFVGGHSSFAYGEYLHWLEERGGRAELLTPQCALAPRSGAPGCYKMGMPAELHYNRYIADSTIRVLEESAKDDAAPFFIWCSFPDPHLPLAPVAPYCDMYDPRSIPLPRRRAGELASLPPFYARIFDGSIQTNGVDNSVPVSDEHWREMIAFTYGMITHVDAEIGRVLNTLDAHGLAKDTLVIFTSDHGDMMGDHGLLWKGVYTFQGCINIPTIIAAPDAAPRGISPALISQIDLLPGVLDYCGVPLPGGSGGSAGKQPFQRGAVRPLAPYPGRSWLPVVRGATPAIRDHVVIENDDPTTGYQVRCLVTEKHRLTIYPGTDDGELFDLATDPGELFNLWYDPKAGALKSRLLQQLLDGYASHTPFHPIPVWNA